MAASHVGCGWETDDCQTNKVQSEAVLWDQQCWASVRPFGRSGGGGSNSGRGWRTIQGWATEAVNVTPFWEIWLWKEGEREIGGEEIGWFSFVFHEKRQNGEGAVEDIRRDGLPSGWGRVEVWDMDEAHMEELALGEGTRSSIANPGHSMGSGILRFP